MEDITVVEIFVQGNISLYENDIADGSLIAELAGRTAEKYSNFVRLSRYKSHLCYVSTISAFFKAYPCPLRDQLFKTAQQSERQLKTCREKVKHVFPRNVYQLREARFDNLNSFNIPYSDDQKLFKEVAIFVFESVCLQKDKFRHTDTTIWIGRHAPLSVPISSILIENQSFYAIAIHEFWLIQFLMLLKGYQQRAKRK